VHESAIGPYRILSRLGQGGMGDVFLAEDPRLSRRVAIKTLSGSAVDVPDARVRLVREARAAAQLNHPNIAAIYDIVESEGATHVVMELVEGESLSARLQRGPLPPGLVTTLGIQLAGALAEAHAHGIVHRDLKPANVQLTPTGSVKVLDFGLAKSASLTPFITPLDEGSTSGHLGITTPGQILGTPAYMAPEQLRGQPADHRSDLYSLGVLLFELLTGKRPYEAPDFVGLALAVLSGPVPSVRSLAPHVPEGLNQIVARAMERAPELRYQSAAELQSDLAQFADHSGDLPTRSVMLPTTVPGFGRRTRAPRPMWMAGLALLVVGGLGAAWLSVRNPVPVVPARPAGAARVPVVAVLPLVNASGDPANDHIGVGIADALISDLAQLPAVSVVSRASTLEVRSRVAATVAQELGATFVVSGAVQRAGDTLKLSVSLVRADGSVAWGGNYEGRFSDIFALQRQLAEGVTGVLQMTLTEDDRQALAEPTTKDPEAFSYYSQARTLLDRRDVPGNVERAMRLFQAAVDEDPKFALAHAGLGDAYWAAYQQSRDPKLAEEARRRVLEALRIDATSPQVRLTLATIYLGTGNREAAIEELQRIIASHPNNDEAHRLKGDALVQAGRLEEGLQEIRTAIRLRPTYWRNEGRHGVALFRAGRYEEAIAAFTSVLHQQPDSDWALMNMGAAQQAVGRNDDAIESYRRSVSLAPSAEAYSNMGMLLHEARRLPEAIAAYRKSLELRPNVSITHRNLGDALLVAGAPKEARASYRRALALAGEDLGVNALDPITLGQVAVLEAKLDQRAEARAHAARAVEMGPNVPEVVYSEAVVHALSRRPLDALRSLERALALGQSPTIARNDDDLRSLHTDPTFRRLLEPVANNKKESQ
jgi:eukaryotic-like serine/threonine-protein kinase